MRNLAIAVSVIAFGGLLVSVPASAENIMGGQLAQNGKCFKYSAGETRDGRFGSWSDCPQTASATTVSPAPAQNYRGRKTHNTSR